MTELKSCPFCGGTEADGSIERAHGTKYVMHSESDDCAAFRGVLIPTQQWNRRASQAAPAHEDDLAVDRFAAVMKAKLAKKRNDGRGGWSGPECSQETLSRMLRDHIAKGDPVDVANLAMMLHQRGERIAQAAPAPSDELAEIDAMLMDGQGDDDGDQVLPGFEPGWSVAAKIEACLHLLEKRRDVICAAQVVDDQLSDGGVTERAHTDLALALSEVSTARHPAPSDGLREAWIAGRDAAASVVAEGWAENRYQEEIDAALIALTPPAALTPAPAQDGGE